MSPLLDIEADSIQQALDDIEFDFDIAWADSWSDPLGRDGGVLLLDELLGYRRSGLINPSLEAVS